MVGLRVVGAEVEEALRIILLYRILELLHLVVEDGDEGEGEEARSVVGSSEFMHQLEHLQQRLSLEQNLHQHSYKMWGK